VRDFERHEIETELPIRMIQMQIFLLDPFTCFSFFLSFLGTVSESCYCCSHQVVVEVGWLGRSIFPNEWTVGGVCMSNWMPKNAGWKLDSDEFVWNWSNKVKKKGAKQKVNNKKKKNKKTHDPARQIDRAIARVFSICIIKVIQTNVFNHKLETLAGI
jgi:hypothetical protein